MLEQLKHCFQTTLDIKWAGSSFTGILEDTDHIYTGLLIISVLSNNIIAPLYAKNV